MIRSAKLFESKWAARTAVFISAVSARLQVCFMHSRIIYSMISMAALCIYALQRMKVRIPWIVNNYMNDFLCLPLLLGGISFLIRLMKRDKEFKFSPGFIIALASYYSFYFEYYLPKVNPRYTADPADVFLYFSGGLLFYLYEKYFNAASNRA